MKKLFTALVTCLWMLALMSCNNAEKRVQSILDSTEKVVSHWERYMRTDIFTDEKHKEFTDQFNQLVQHNKAQGIRKDQLTADQVKKVEQLYGRAKAVKSNMIVREMQNEFTRRGNNWAGERIEVGTLNIEF